MGAPASSSNQDGANPTVSLTSHSSDEDNSVLIVILLWFNKESISLLFKVCLENYGIST